MAEHLGLRVLDAARSVVDEINQILDAAVGPVPYSAQLRDAAQSIAANIVEAYGRREGRERNQFLRYARGSTEETNEHWRAGFSRGRVPTKEYWRLHNRLVTIGRMLTALIAEQPGR